MRLEADHLRREASLRRREEAQDGAERLAFMDEDNSVFWDSLADEPSDSESDLTASISSRYSPPAPSTPRPVRQSQQGTSYGQTKTPEPVGVGDARVYNVTSPSMQGLTETWCTFLSLSTLLY